MSLGSRSPSRSLPHFRFPRPHVGRAFISPSFVHLQPTRSAVTLARLLSALGRVQSWRVVGGTAWESVDEVGEGEAKALTFELIAPAHDGTARVGASARVLPLQCWLNGRVSHATLHKRGVEGKRPAALLAGRTSSGGSSSSGIGGSSSQCGGSPGNATAAAAERAWAAALHFHRARPLGEPWSTVAAPLPWRHQLERTLVDPIMGAALRWEGAREAAVQTHCNATMRASPQQRRLTTLSRPLNYLADPASSAWPINCAANGNISMELCAVVSRVAVNRAVMSAVANSNIANDAYLGRFADLVTRTARVRNFLVVALDEKTGSYLSKRGVAYYVRRFKTRTGADSSTTDNHATSALKFVILSELLSIGVSVLLTDVDVPVFSDPFSMIYGDAGVENMSDGCRFARFEGTRKQPRRSSHTPLL